MVAAICAIIGIIAILFFCLVTSFGEKSSAEKRAERKQKREEKRRQRELVNSFKFDRARRIDEENYRNEREGKYEN